MIVRSKKVPQADHPITILANPSRVVAFVAGRPIADSQGALTLNESSYPAVQYFPRRDVEMSLLTRTDHQTFCPYKGDCTYYSISAGGKHLVNAAWSYEEPFESVAQIRDYLAFYRDRVDIEED
jgi:uncharacterized protein (DUF427 family)